MLVRAHYGPTTSKSSPTLQHPLPSRAQCRIGHVRAKLAPPEPPAMDGEDEEG